MLVSSDGQDMDDSMFDTNGSARDWAHRPAVELYNPAPKSKQREPANILPFMTGSFVLDTKARAAIGGFLSRFGQLLELHRSGDGDVLYMFNCTNVVDCVDGIRTMRTPDGRIKLEVIDESRVPEEPTVFKAPQTATVRNYVNDAGKAVLEQWASDAGIVGLAVVQLDPV